MGKALDWLRFVKIDLVQGIEGLIKWRGSAGGAEERRSGKRGGESSRG